MFTQVKVTAISLKPEKWNKPHNAEKMENLFVKASRKKPDVILETEGALEGYVVLDVLEQPERAAEFLEIAEPIDGPYINRFRTLAKKLKTCLCFGFAERIKQEVYNAAVFIGPDGEICGKYHKTQFAEGTHPTEYFNRIGKKIRAFETPIGRAGFLICNDRWNPDIARTLVLDGASVLLIPSYGSKSKEQNETVLARARENGVPIVEANVGMNLIVSKGEIVAYKWGDDQITTSIIEIPIPATRKVARESELNYLKTQKVEMLKRHRKRKDDNWFKMIKNRKFYRYSHGSKSGRTA